MLTKKVLKIFRNKLEIWCEKIIKKRCILNAHALGVYHGMTYTNCKEAYIDSYQLGIKNFEADISVTKDGKYVLSHDFDQVCSMTETEFISSSEKGTHLTLCDMLQLMKTNCDIEVMFDFLPGFYDRQNSDEIFRFASEIIRNGIQERSFIEVYSVKQLDTAKAAGINNLQMSVELPHPFDKELRSIDDYIRILDRYCVNKVSVSANNILENPYVLKKLHDSGFIIYSSGWGSYCRLFFTPKTKYIDYLTTDMI